MKVVFQRFKYGKTARPLEKKCQTILKVRNWMELRRVGTWENVERKKSFVFQVTGQLCRYIDGWRYRTVVWLKSHAWNGGLGFLSWRKEKNKVLVEFHRRREKNMRWRNSTVSLKHIKKSVISNSKGFYHRELRLYGAGGIGYTFYSKIKGSRRLVWKC